MMFKLLRLLHVPSAELLNIRSGTGARPPGARKYKMGGGLPSVAFRLNSIKLDHENANQSTIQFVEFDNNKNTARTYLQHGWGFRFRGPRDVLGVRDGLHRCREGLRKADRRHPLGGTYVERYIDIYSTHATGA